VSRSSPFSKRITVASFRFAEKRARSCFFCFDIDISVEGIIAPSGVSQSIVATRAIKNDSTGHTNSPP